MTLLFARGITSRIAGCRATWRGWPAAPFPTLWLGAMKSGALNRGAHRGGRRCCGEKALALENALHGIAEVNAARRATCG